MDAKIENELYSRLMEEFGIEKQTLMLAEEQGELIKAINKKLRFKTRTVDEIREELADVYIMMNQVRWYFGISIKEIAEEMDKKLERIQYRLKKGEL